MAERNIVGSLFGMTPEMYQQGMARRTSGDNLAAAQLTPGQLAGYYAMEAGSGLGRATQGLLGVEDPELAKIRDVQSMRGQFDVSTPAGLRSFAQALSNKGYTDLAMQATAKAAAIDEDIANAEAKRTEKIKQVGLTTDGRQVYQSGTEQFILGPGGIKQPYYGSLESKQSKTNINVNTAGEKNILDIDKEDAKNLVKVRDTAERTIPRLEEQLAAVKKGMIAGTFSDARAVFTNSLASLGIKDEATLKLLKNTDSFNANRIELASAVAKQLGVNPTDRDFQASLSRFASGSMQPEVAEAFINDMLAIQRKNLTDAKQGLDYYRAKGGSFAGYDRPLPKSPTASDPLQNMSLEELRALEAKLSKGK